MAEIENKDLEALIREWIQLRDDFKAGNDIVLYRVVEVENILQNQLHIDDPIKWLLNKGK